MSKSLRVGGVTEVAKFSGTSFRFSLEATAALEDNDHQLPSLCKGDKQQCPAVLDGRFKTPATAQLPRAPLKIRPLLK